jgi:hypothetical protein
VVKKSAPAISPQWARRNVRHEDGRAGRRDPVGLEHLGDRTPGHPVAQVLQRPLDACSSMRPPWSGGGPGSRLCRLLAHGNHDQSRPRRQRESRSLTVRRRHERIGPMGFLTRTGRHQPSWANRTVPHPGPGNGVRAGRVFGHYAGGVSGQPASAAHRRHDPNGVGARWGPTHSRERHSPRGAGGARRRLYRARMRCRAA